MFKKRFIFILWAIIIVPAAQVWASAVDYGQYVAIKFSEESVALLRDLNKRAISAAAELYSPKRQRSIRSEMQNAQMIDLSGTR